MNEVLQEFCDSRDVRVRVDRDEGVLRGVKILGLTSRNGRRYLEEALSEAASLYDGAKVNVNHPKGSPLSPRDYQDRIGVIRNVSVQEQDGLFGDLHFNPKHALAQQLLWDAENATENVGFSHNVMAQTARKDGDVVVEKITQVTSVDLVADPATTRGLFESEEKGCPSKPIEHVVDVQHLSCAQLKEARPDLVEELFLEHEQEITELRETIDRLQAVESLNARREIALAMIRECGLPDPESSDPAAQRIVGPMFLESLLSAKDKAEMKLLVEERVRLVQDASQWQSSMRGQKPISRDQQSIRSSGKPVRNSSEFANAIS